jgi:hypothetical protein
LRKEEFASDASCAGISRRFGGKSEFVKGAITQKNLFVTSERKLLVEWLAVIRQFRD